MTMENNESCFLYIDSECDEFKFGIGDDPQLMKSIGTMLTFNSLFFSKFHSYAG